MNGFEEHECHQLEHHEQIVSDFDVVFCTSYMRLIPQTYLDLPKHGVFINHSTDLPLGRGWAPIQWSVLKGLSEITVTVFKAIDDGECDTGPWAFKGKYDVEIFDTLPHLYEKDRKVSLKLFLKVIKALENNTLVAHDQIGKATFNPRRRPEDSELDSSKPLIELWNHIRVCCNDDYPAFFRINGHKVYLRSQVERDSPRTR